MANHKIKLKSLSSVKKPYKKVGIPQIIITKSYMIVNILI